MPSTRISFRTPFRIRYALIALGGALLFGTAGFHLIEGWSLADSLYVTVQTLTTVGYGDLTPRNGTGRLFAVVERGLGLAACLPNDADNVYVVLTARDLNPRLHIVARAAEEQAESKLLRAGANHVVAPTIIGGHRMAVSLTKPAVSEFFDSITGSELGLGFEQVEVDVASPLVGQELRGTPIRAELDIVVISIRRHGGEIIFN